jgi:hypothetical protein
MKPGRMLIAAVLLAGLGGAVWWSNKQEKAKEGEPAKDAPPRILAIAADTVKQIEIQRRGQEPTTVQFNASGKWEITRPKPLPADGLAVSELTTTTSKLDSERVVDPNVSDLASYGLAPPLLQVSITQKDGKVSKLLIGENTPAGSAVYAKLDGDPRLFSMPSANKTSLDKDSKDLRDKRLLSFSQDKLSRLELTARKQTFEFAKAGETDWQIVKPKVMRADATQLDDLVLKLKNAVMIPGLDADAKQADAAFASAMPLATVKVTDPKGVQTLEIRKSKDDYYAKSSALEGVHKVGKDLADGLDRPLGDFRNKKLFDFGFNDPTRIEVTDGPMNSVYTKTGETWMSSGKIMDSTGMQAFVDKLRDLASIKFVDGGFTTPVVTLTVVSRDGKHSEKVEISQAASGGNFIARHDGDASFYEIEAGPVKDLRQAAGDVREAQPEKKKK